MREDKVSIPRLTLTSAVFHSFLVHSCQTGSVTSPPAVSSDHQDASPAQQPLEPLPEPEQVKEDVSRTALGMSGLVESVEHPREDTPSFLDANKTGLSTGQMDSLTRSRVLDYSDESLTKQ